MLFFGRSRTALSSGGNKVPEGPPSIGVIAESLRRTLVDDFDTYFPSLNMETQNDGRILLKAQDQNTGLNIEIEIKDLNLSTTVVPQAPGGVPGAAPGAAPPAGMGGASTAPPTTPGATPPPPGGGTGATPPLPPPQPQ